MVLEVTHKELKELVNVYYDSKISLFVTGRFGIGKSVLIKDKAREIAKKKGRKFIEWNNLTEEEKQTLFKNPKENFVYIDIRLSEYSPDDIKGLPMFLSGNRAIEFKIPLWALYLELEGSDGFLMFDEINLAVPIVQSSAYKIVYDRVVNQSKIWKDWGIVMAGNTSDDKAYIHDMPLPLRDRCGEVQLNNPTIEDWTDWAIKSEIHSAIIGYLNSSSSKLWVVDEDDSQKSTTPRGWERLSKIIKNNKIELNDYNKLLLVSSSAIGEGVASGFVAFCKIQDKVKIQEIIKNPNKLKELNSEKDIGIKYFIITALADCYRDKKAEFKDIMNITEVLDELNNPEFVSLMWRLCLQYKPEFENEFLKGNTIKIANKYLKFLR